MPTTLQLKVVVGDKGDSGLKVGDTVTIRGRSGVIHNQEELVKYMRLDLTDGDEHFNRKVPLGTEINVLRSVLTEDEELANELARFARKVIEHATSANNQVAQAVVMLNETYRDGRAKGLLYPFDLSRAAQAARLQYDRALWSAVAGLAADNLSGDGDHRKILSAVMVVREQCVSDLTNRYRNSLSRSTSVISNLEADMKLDAASEFLKTTDWMGAEHLWERVG